MKTVVFDTGPIISLTLNNILWVVESLAERFGGEFLITGEVYNELIKKPLSTKKYKFEALQILPLVAKGILKIKSGREIDEAADRLLELANSCYSARGSSLRIVHRGEMEVLACALACGCDTVVIDERTTRSLVEDPTALGRYLEKKLHSRVEVDRQRLSQLQEQLSGLHVVRSFELAVVAYDMGLLNIFAQKDAGNFVPDIRKAVLEGVLWAIKLAGCSVRSEDIYQVIDSYSEEGKENIQNQAEQDRT